MNKTADDFLVIGAGLAGLACARTLVEAGATVAVVDKSRGVGGRAATRTFEGVKIDHGAQYFTARGERLQSLVAQGLSDGWLAIWSYGFPLWKDGQIQEREPGHPRYAPISGMNELGKRLATGLTVHTSATVVSIGQDRERYIATTEDGRQFSAAWLILNLPPQQLRAVAQNVLSEKMIAATGSVIYLPAWALLLRLDRDLPQAGWPALEFQDHPILGWVSRDHTKRGSAAPPALVVHGNGRWSQEHLEASPERIMADLREATESVCGPLAVFAAQAHRWRYALPTRVLPERFLWDGERRLACCGDWCDGPRVEGALESGWHLADKILANVR